MNSKILGFLVVLPLAVGQAVSQQPEGPPGAFAINIQYPPAQGFFRSLTSFLDTNLAVRNGAKVGIGTTAPSHLLDIFGDVAFRGPKTYLLGSDGAAPQTGSHWLMAGSVDRDDMKALGFNVVSRVIRPGPRWTLVTRERRTASGSTAWRVEGPFTNQLGQWCNLSYCPDPSAQNGPQEFSGQIPPADFVVEAGTCSGTLNMWDDAGRRYQCQLACTFPSDGRSDYYGGVQIYTPEVKWMWLRPNKCRYLLAPLPPNIIALVFEVDYLIIGKNADER